MKYSNIPSERRPKIAILQHSRYVGDTLRSVNLLLSKQLENVGSLEAMVDVVYAGAATVCGMYEGTLNFVKIIITRHLLERFVWKRR